MRGGEGRRWRGLECAWHTGPGCGPFLSAKTGKSSWTWGRFIPRSEPHQTTETLLLKNRLALETLASEPSFHLRGSCSPQPSSSAAGPAGAVRTTAYRHAVVPLTAYTFKQLAHILSNLFLDHETLFFFLLWDHIKCNVVFLSQRYILGIFPWEHTVPLHSFLGYILFSIWPHRSPFRDGQCYTRLYREETCSNGLCNLSKVPQLVSGRDRAGTRPTWFQGLRFPTLLPHNVPVLHVAIN